MDDAVAACVGWSLSSRRAWIEIPLFAWPSGPRVGRSPHGERGLKLRHARLTRLRIRRSPHGERGLKSQPAIEQQVSVGRSPHGERGLKWLISIIYHS